MLDLRLALWVAMGVPISFLGAFLFFDLLDVNINMVSLFALIMVIGIVVDDAVVVGENISSQWDAGHVGPEASRSPARAAYRARWSSASLTTMAAFAPLSFVTGTFGQILGVVPLVVITVLADVRSSRRSGFCRRTCRVRARGGRWPLDAFQAGVAGAVRRFRDNRLVPMIRGAVRRRYRDAARRIVGACRRGRRLLWVEAVRFLFFPTLEADNVRADIEFPVGTPFRDGREPPPPRSPPPRTPLNEDVGGTSVRALSVTVGRPSGRVRGARESGGNGDCEPSSPRSRCNCIANRCAHWRRPSWSDAGAPRSARSPAPNG